ncbi:MAG: hypothetical protein FWH33_00515 [Oscillospiraceae bacterium]|nr:hypothetical protein [Oscillospiraceae bacterium]
MKRMLPVLKFVIPIIVLLFLIFKNGIFTRHEIRLSINQLPEVRELIETNYDFFDLLLHIKNRIIVHNNSDDKISIQRCIFRVDSANDYCFSINLDTTPSLSSYDEVIDASTFLVMNNILDKTELEIFEKTKFYIDIVVTDQSISVLFAENGRAYLTLWHPLDIYDVRSRVDENNQYTTDKMDATYWHLEIFNDDWFIELRYMQRN